MNALIIASVFIIPLSIIIGILRVKNKHIENLIKSKYETIKYYSDLKRNDDKLSEQMIREMQSIESDNAKLKEAIEYLESNIRRKDETIKELLFDLAHKESEYDQLAVEYLTDVTK